MGVILTPIVSDNLFGLFRGFFNCLTADGQVYDTTKYGWLQGRQVWMYCQLYTSLDRFKKDALLQAAINGTVDAAC